MKNKKTPGQAVVIITIFVAVIILLSIVLINIGKVSDIKTSTAQIADSGTLNLASEWSMYCNSLRDTMLRKGQASTLLGIGCICNETSCRCLNWGLIIPVAAMFLAIVLMPLVMPISLALFYMAVNPLWTEVDAIMKSGFQSAAAQNTEYAAMRESAISSMLEQAQFDPENAERWQNDVFHYVLSKRWDPVKKDWIYTHYVYDLTESPIAASVKRKQKIPRFTAWYWSQRYPKVTEAGLTKEIKAFIDALVKITEFNDWSTAEWNYKEVSLKVTDPKITCGAGTCPDWAVPEKGITRILAHVSATEQNVLQDFLNWILGLFGQCPTTQQGFLPIKFIDLTNRLRANPTYGSYITWTQCDIVKVVEALRGMMVRDMELLNIPVSHRIPSLNNWLPSWYNTRDHSQDIYTRLEQVLDKNDGELKGVREWLRVLRLIEPLIATNVADDHGSENHYGLGNTAEICNYACIKCCCDCPCECCGTSPGPCNRYGIYCSACGGPNPPVCGLHDLYNTIPPWCPLQYWNPCYQACYCPDADSCDDACQFQGMLSKDAPSDPTEVAQAIAVLEKLETALVELRAAIELFATRADAIMNPTNPTIIQLQKEAIYGWQDLSRPNRGSYNIVRVNLDNYPSRDKLPYIKESYEWMGLFKVWTIEGQTSGPIGEVTVSRYTSDISVGAWWTLKYRNNPGAQQWPLNDVSGIISGIQSSGAPGSAAAGLVTYGITSATKGNYGMHKDEIYIQRVK